VRLGIELGGGASTAIAQGNRVILAQEIRNARGGHYTFNVRASGGGSARDVFERLLASVTCRMVLFRFADIRKDPRQMQVLASANFQPQFGAAGSFSVDRFLGSTTPGANFPIGNGLGVAVVVEKASAGALTLNGPQQAFLHVHSATLEFHARPRDDSVTV
jgi:hypothetical protein